MKTSKAEKRLHVYYSGAVQGVGFRFTAERSALSLGLTGWVKNLENGDVEVVCEGSEARLKKFLEKMKEVFGRYIREADVRRDEPAEGFAGFDIRF